MNTINFNKISFKISFVLLLMLLVFVSCKKEEDLQQKETTQREQYLKDNNITTQPTSSGLYYIENVAGTGDTAVQGLFVKIVYEGQFLNGEIFGADTVEFEYGTGSVIAGLDEALSYMKIGGKSTVIIPSNLAFGSSGNKVIPPYTTLIYKIELLEVFSAELREIEQRNVYLASNEIIKEPTISGLYYLETLTGTGLTPLNGQTVQVNYVGRFLDGEVFDSGTFEFQIGKGQVIKGFDEGVSYMKKDGKATLIIPSQLGYGKYGNAKVPPYTTLIFDLQLLNIQ